MTSPALPQLNLRRHEIAAVLNVSVWKVDRLIDNGNGVLPSFKIGGTRVARYEDVKAYNDRCAGAATSAQPPAPDHNVIPLRPPKRQRRAAPG